MNNKTDSLFSASPSVQSTRVLYTPSTFARSSLLHLQETGSLTALQPHTSKRSNLASYLCFMVLAGKGELEYSGKTWPLQTGDCVFIDCRRPYAHSTSRPELWSLCWAHFDGPSMAAVYDKYVERGGSPVLHPEKPEEYEKLLRSLYDITDSQDYIRDMHINEMLAQLLSLLMAESWNPNTEHFKGKRQQLQEIKAYLDNHYLEKILLDDLSGRFFINKYYLTRIFREQYGRSINHYILEKRITQAKNLLRFTEESVEAIGSACGMSDANYFTRIFKKIEGITPGEYRRMW